MGIKHKISMKYYKMNSYQIIGRSDRFKQKKLLRSGCKIYTL